jgi:uncharacterized membrane protein
MLRLLQILSGLIALVFNVFAILYFGDWFGKTDWLMGHVYGPASSIIAAVWTASAGVIATAIWMAVALFRRFGSSAERQEKRSREASVAELVEALQSPDYGPRFWAVAELEKMGPRAKAAVPALAQGCRSRGE